MTFQRIFLLLGAISGLLAVTIGAFGAHALPHLLGASVYAEAVRPFNTGVDYHFYHTLALLGLALLPAHRLTRWAGWCFSAGILLFSFSLYLLAITGIRWLGAITPFGGLLFISGWGLLAAFAWKTDIKSRS